MKRMVFTIGVDLALLVLAFAMVHAVNYGHLRVSETGWDVLRLHVLVWLFVSVVAGKFTRVFGMDLLRGTGLLFKTGVAMLFLTSLVIVGMQWTHFSRSMAYGTLIVFVAMEVLVLAFIIREKGLGSIPRGDSWRRSIKNISRPLFILDGWLLIAAFFLGTYLKRGSVELYEPYSDILLILFGLWLAGSLITRQFDKRNFNDFFSAIGPAIKAVLFMAAGVTFFIFILRLEPVSRFQIFSPLIFLLGMKAIVFGLYVSYREHGGAMEDIESPEIVREMLSSEKGKEQLVPAPVCPVTHPVDEKLRHALDFFDPRIYEMLEANVDLGSIDRNNCALISTDNMFNLDVMDSGGMQLIINLHKVNDMRWFNRYFLSAHEKLAPGAYFMGKAHTISTRRSYYRENYPKYLGGLYYGLSFVWGRVFPKLPWLQKLYFAVTRGRDRMVSRAEILGRLCFCGFKIVDEKEIGHRFFFIAQKVGVPSLDENPTYGPLVRLNRSGLGGQPIKVYKFRTMYPFSEYLQDYVYQLNSLSEGGKFKDDFRVTGWGKFMRRTWLDELPMLYNWLRGDLQVVGVRPLSSQYLALYDGELQVLRQSVKPGLLPPFYADMPKTVEEIMASERRYIKKFLKRPMRTQVRYFGKCVWNIGVRGKRSA